MEQRVAGAGLRDEEEVRKDADPSELAPSPLAPTTGRQSESRNGAKIGASFLARSYGLLAAVFSCVLHQSIDRSWCKMEMPGGASSDSA